MNLRFDAYLEQRVKIIQKKKIESRRLQGEN